MDLTQQKCHSPVQHPSQPRYNSHLQIIKLCESHVHKWEPIGQCHNPLLGVILWFCELKTSLSNMAAWWTLKIALWILACWDPVSSGSPHHRHHGKYTSLHVLHILRWWLNHSLVLSHMWLHEVREQSLLDSLLTLQHHQFEFTALEV